MGKYLIFVPFAGDDDIEQWVYLNSVDADGANKAISLVKDKYPDLGEFKLYVRVNGGPFSTDQI